MPKNIVLIGFMGAGKSLVANILSRKLQMERVSTDEMIEKSEKKTIAEIFEQSGEAFFRQKEKAVVRKICSQKNLVVDCGGGIVLDPQNIEDLKKNGRLFYLSTSPEVVYRRLKSQTNRPLLQVADPLSRIKEMLTQREKLYKKAHHTIDTDQQTVEQTAAEVFSLLQQKISRSQKAAGSEP